MFIFLYMMRSKLSVTTIAILLLLPVIFYGRLHFLRPPHTDRSQSLFPGIEYRREASWQPRPVMMHIVAIDLQTPGLKLLVTPKTSNNSRTTSAFSKEFKMKLAINASYFAPFHEHTPWDYYPRTGDPSAPIGEAISNGDRYGAPLKEWPVFCILPGNIAEIIDSGTCPKNTINGVAGRELLVSNGRPIASKLLADDDKPYPRVAVGIDRNGKKLWLIIIDGKQPLYSEGVTKVELSQIFAKLGVDKALNLDGGGSTTLVVDTGNGATVLNAPIHAKLPMNERPVANQIGFYLP
jgi:exopolysaccharide biosynthesis protein